MSIMQRASITVGLAIMAAIAILIVSPSPSKAASAASAKPTVAMANIPIKDCATVPALTVGAILGLNAAGLGATAITGAGAVFGTTGAALNGALIGVFWGAADPMKRCNQHVGNSAATAICSASNFSTSDPRGNAARLLVWVATAGKYTRCAP